MKFLGLSAVLLTVCLDAKDVVQESEFCSINWSDGYVQCKGESDTNQKAFQAKRSAVVLAQRNLLELIKGVNIDSQMTVNDGMLQSDVVKTSVSGMVKGALVVSNQYNKADGSAVATLKIHMGKDLLKALNNTDADDDEYAVVEKLKSFLSRFGTTNLEAAESYSVQDQKTIEKLIKDFQESQDNVSLAYLQKLLKDVKSKNYSGLLIDAREIGDIKPALTIKLVNSKGKEIYPGKYVDSSQFVGKNGVSVGLDFDIEDARKNKRVFSEPLEMVGESTYKQRKSDIVLSDDNIKKLNVAMLALKKGKVIVVVPD